MIKNLGNNPIKRKLNRRTLKSGKQSNYILNIIVGYFISSRIFLAIKYIEMLPKEMKMSWKTINLIWVE